MLVLDQHEETRIIRLTISEAVGDKIREWIGSIATIAIRNNGVALHISPQP
jgi:hypothetical protein